MGCGVSLPQDAHVPLGHPRARRLSHETADTESSHETEGRASRVRCISTESTTSCGSAKLGARVMARGPCKYEPDSPKLEGVREHSFRRGLWEPTEAEIERLSSAPALVQARPPS